MTRDEMINRLKTIKPTAFPTVITNDMGLQFDIMDSTGAGTNLGNIGDWPLWKFKKLTVDEINQIQTMLEKNEIKTEVIRNGFFRSFLDSIIKQYENVDLRQIFTDIITLKNENDFFYVYCDTQSWEYELKFFNTEDDIINDFFERFQIYNTWEEMDDNSLENYFEELEENGEGLPFYVEDDNEQEN